jgi:hypothetical protein
MNGEGLAPREIEAEVSRIPWTRCWQRLVGQGDGCPREIAARWLLNSVHIEPGRVVAVLSTI